MVVAETASFQAAPARDVPSDFHRFAFMGSGKEYFGIWIVNVLLTIVTLGIYSAWAKVRRNRYFYGNTVLLGRAFEYHANGKQILIGRLIVLGGLVVLNVIATLVPILALLPTLAVIIALPWLVVRGLRFNARVTSYRNVRFDFVGGVGGAFKAFILGGLLTIISLGLLAPLASRWTGRYVGSNLRFGGKAFHTDPPLAPLYRGLLIGALFGIVVGIVAAAIIMGTFRATAPAENGLDDTVQVSLVWLLAGSSYVVLLLVYGTAMLFYRAAVRNAVWSATRFDEKHRFLSGLSRGRYTWIAISNLLVTIVTLGLMRPWAAVRMARYTWEHTSVLVAGSVGTLVSEIEQQGSAVGAEFIEFEGFDFGF
ncbi:YjgN family protein [Ensifer sp. MJa1]|uniref:YjgN family protein n=1 Tax=Ensifer sp. MJa1 TaxID=2919888 RepID=UPI00300A7D0D